LEGHVLLQIVLPATIWKGRDSFRVVRDHLQYLFERFLEGKAVSFAMRDGWMLDESMMEGNQGFGSVKTWLIGSPRGKVVFVAIRLVYTLILAESLLDPS